MPTIPRVQLFITCIIDSLFPEVGEAVVTVLERLGVAVEFPAEQTCCGQPGYNAGFRPQARDLALRFLDIFEQSPAPIVTPSGSCAAMIIHGYPDLLRDDPVNCKRAEAVAARTYEFAHFLVAVLGVDPATVAATSTFTGKATFHTACHLTRGLGQGAAGQALLAAVPGADVVPLPQAEVCCGFGGLFAVKHGEVSAAMLDNKLANVRATGAEALVSCDMSCLMHLEGGLRRDHTAVRCLHLAEVLARG
ncbi:MAG: (Fe-S)-binding protein [Anaerolineales bacterium]|nr:(Fe-S)-binding protein [Anaerolineales bacterium]